MDSVAREILKGSFERIYINNHKTPNEFFESCVDLTTELVNAVVRDTNIDNANSVGTTSLDWLPISTAHKDINCGEIIGCRIYNGVMMKEPFISFWSPTLQRYYCDPTHWIALPTMPVITDKDTQIEEQVN